LLGGVTAMQAQVSFHLKIRSYMPYLIR